MATHFMAVFCVSVVIALAALPETTALEQRVDLKDLYQAQLLENYHVKCGSTECTGNEFCAFGYPAKCKCKNGFQRESDSAPCTKVVKPKNQPTASPSFWERFFKNPVG